MSAVLSAFASGVLYAIWCSIFYYLHVYLLSPKTADEWEKTGIYFFVVLGFLAGTIIGCIAGLLRISRVTTALLACCFTSAFVLLLISDDLAYLDAPSFRTLAIASILFHLIIGGIIGLVCFDIRNRLEPRKVKRKRISIDLIDLNPASSAPPRIPTINFTKAFEFKDHIQADQPIAKPAFMTSLVLELPSAEPQTEAPTIEPRHGLKFNYRLLDSFPNPETLQNLHSGMLPAITKDTKITELPTASLPSIIPGLATT